MIRIVIEQKAWGSVLFFCCVAYFIVLQVFFRGRNFRTLLWGTEEELINKIPGYSLLSCVYILLLSMLTYILVPERPWSVLSWDIFGYRPNIFGFCLMVYAAYFIFKFLLGRLLYGLSGSTRKFIYLQTFMLRWYLLTVPLLLILSFVYFFHFYPNTNYNEAFRYFLLGIFFIKLIGIVSLTQKVLPRNHYLKIVYLCTLQIMPVVVLIKVLFF